MSVLALVMLALAAVAFRRALSLSAHPDGEGFSRVRVDLAKAPSSWS